MLECMMVYPGFAEGRAFIINDVEPLTERHMILNPANEIKKLNEAIKKTQGQLEIIRHYHQGCQYFEKYNWLLNLGELVKQIKEKIIMEYLNGEWAVKETVDFFRRVFGALGDEDTGVLLQDIGERIIRNLLDFEENSVISRDSIIVSPRLMPSQFMLINPGNIKGIIFKSPVIADFFRRYTKSNKIPTAIIPDFKAVMGDYIVLDALNLKTIVNPDAKQLQDFKKIIDISDFTETIAQEICSLDLSSDLDCYLKAKRIELAEINQKYS